MKMGRDGVGRHSNTQVACDNHLQPSITFTQLQRVVASYMVFAWGYRAYLPHPAHFLFVIFAGTKDASVGHCDPSRKWRRTTSKYFYEYFDWTNSVNTRSNHLRVCLNKILSVDNTDMGYTYARREIIACRFTISINRHVALEEFHKINPWAKLAASEIL